MDEEVVSGSILVATADDVCVRHAVERERDDAQRVIGVDQELGAVSGAGVGDHR